MRADAVHEDAVAGNDDIGRLAVETGISQYMLRGVRAEWLVTVDKQGSQGKSRWILPEALEQSAQESARKFDAGRASLEETAEISKLARCDEPPQVWGPVPSSLGAGPDKFGRGTRRCGGQECL